MRILVTRPEPDAQSTIDRLRAIGIEGVAAPLMSRVTLDFHLPALEGFAALAVTSTNALRALAERQPLDPLLHLPVYAVGDRTAHEARLLGFTDVVSTGGTLDGLATTLALARIAGPILYPAGRHLSGDLARALAPHGVMVVTVTTYDMVAEPALPPSILAQLQDDGFGAVLLYSRRSAEIFAHLTAPSLPETKRRALAALCLAENVAQPLIEWRFNRVHLADRPDEEAMMALALAFAREQSGP
ncbi:hypothetical protein VW35_10180 [Devosia soli]|uniref:Uroporphyrinogen-III synthase n=1 Tax=Devosia soli TaxID=361041 RepID=A0A0F5L8X4_9HYPH|nr:uroporphyrinogen-III synthase [Devosia soli]KKB78851.1 hypothetical protein VW35_10180 [Devosia soli]